ncbi:MAG: 1-phosphofructokinase family hexose kinase [Ruminococcus sp.]|jgi:1-phosphofructokinase|nr:1-phosphofructokinase family hexose kinase [Ruminococcus sp.]
MIYTITLNPAVDYYIETKTKNNTPGQVIRAENTLIRAGGKGINVGIILTRLGVPCKALGFIGGFTGDEVRYQCRKYQLNTSFIRIPAEKTRINVKLKGEDKDTEINAPSPVIPSNIAAKLLKQVSVIEPGDIVVLSGSSPASLTDNFYAQICSELHKGVLIAADLAGNALKEVLPFNPFLIKPNHIELCEFLNAEITTDRDKLFHYAEKLICHKGENSGAKNIIVSIGAEGAIMIDSAGTRRYQKAPNGNFSSAVGAGDSLVGGFIDGYIRYGDFGDALKRGVAAGSATAFSEWLADKQAIEAVYREMT